MTTYIRIEHGADHVIMSWDGSQASAPIRDLESTEAWEETSYEAVDDPARADASADASAVLYGMLIRFSPKELVSART